MPSKKMGAKNSNILAYIALIILICILLLKNCSTKPVRQDKKPDTVTVTKIKIVHDTIPGETKLVEAEVDTSIWVRKSENKPDTTYEGLLKQYTALGNKLFTKKLYSTKFQIKDYGSVTVNDSISENSLIYSDIITDLKIPSTTITVTKFEPPKRELYLGFNGMGNSLHPIKYIGVGGLFKDKKEHIYNVSLGYDGEVLLGGGLYWKVK